MVGLLNFTDQEIHEHTPSSFFMGVQVTVRHRSFELFVSTYSRYRLFPIVVPGTEDPIVTKGAGLSMRSHESKLLPISVALKLLALLDDLAAGQAHSLPLHSSLIE
jgi:hypothetical protein